jgi:hypothetical protein
LGHILLKYCETKKWREECVHSKCLNTNEDLAYRKTISCTNVTKINSLGKYLFKIKCKWENKVRGTQPPLRAAGSQNIEREIGLRVEIVREL